MRLFTLLAALAAICFSTEQASANEDMLKSLFHCGGPVCNIRDNPGGLVGKFEIAVEQALAKGVHARIGGKCFSACLIFASRARKNVCIEADAEMGLHRGHEYHVYEPLGKEVDLSTEGGLHILFHPPPGYRIEVNFITPDYGADITAWALREDKMPYQGIYVMTRSEALSIWKPCR